MSFMDRLKAGEDGVKLALPERYYGVSESPESLTIEDSESGLRMWLGWSPYRPDLRPAHEALLRRDVERSARDVFDLKRERYAPGAGSPQDPGWSPVIEVAPVTISQVQGLEVVRRASQAPGPEIVMGHLLLPTATGSFEFRAMARATRDAAAGREADDPGLDARFPEHPLSLVRGALRWLRADAGLIVTAPPQPTASDELSLPALECRFAPPPRFVLYAQSGQEAQLARLAYSCREGVSLLTLTRLSGPRTSRLSDAKLELRGTELGRAALPDGAQEAAVVVRRAAASQGRGCAEVVVHGLQSDGTPCHVALRCFDDAWQQEWALSVSSSQAYSEAELFSELEAVVQSFERTGSPPPPRPWWKFW